MRMRLALRHLLSISVLLACVGLGGPASASPTGTTRVRLLAVSASADREGVRLLLDLPAGTTAGDIEITGLSPGGARAGTLSPARTLPSLTVFAFDGGGSFLPTRKLAGRVVEQWADSYVDTTHQAQLLLLGTNTETIGDQLSSRSEMARELSRLISRSPSRSTRLFGGLEDALRKAAASPPGSLREVWLFTDGGSEPSAAEPARIDALVAQAHRAAVRVSLATFHGPGARRGPLTILDQLRSVMRQTGGAEISLASGFDGAWAGLREAAEESRRLGVLDAKVCGLATATQPTVAARLASGAVVEERYTLADPGWAPSAVAVCCDPARCNGWQGCRGLSCEPISCHADGDCGDDAHCVAGACALGAPDDRMLWYAIAGGVALLGLIALLQTRRARHRRRAAEEEARRVRESEEAARREDEERQRQIAASVALAPGPTPVAGMDALPETLLVLLAGPPAQVGQRYRLEARSTTIGANPDNSICVAMPSVSGRHAEFQLFPSGALFVQDFDSTNGLFVDGLRLPTGARIEVRPGSQVSLGLAVRLEVARPGAAATRQDDAGVSQAPPASDAGAALENKTINDRGS